jgi:putative membrane protein
MKKGDIKRSGELFLKGLCMGTADVIPGISGGTIAFMTGIYEDLLEAIKTADIKFLKLVCRFQISQALDYFAWPFLLPLMLGILTAIFSLSKVVHWLLVNEPVYLFSFFFGLITATVPIIGRVVKRWDPANLILLVLSAVLTYFFVGLVPLETPNDLWFLFICGAVAICAMILPGISGAFILLLLGKYQYIIQAVSDRDFLILIVVALGCLVGILSFVRFLSWLLSKYHDITLSILTGLVAGSLRKVWPWREVVETIITSKGKTIPIREINVLPSGMNAELLFAIGLMIIGFVVALFLNSTDTRKIQR